MKHYLYVDAFDKTVSLINNDKKILSVSEVSRLINKSHQFVRDAINNRKLLAYAIQGRTSGKSQNRKTYCIPKINVVLFLLNNSIPSFNDYTPYNKTNLN